MALTDLLARVYARAPRGIEFGLDRVRQAVDALGHPERAWAVLHIAGTNGKGSVAAISSLALERAGYRVGLFTSPHLHRFAERIRVNQEPTGDDLLAHSLEQALAFDLTFFEVAFVASLIAFRESGVDCAVVEVGMGGRLDATNIVEAPVATAVTRIALDHTSVLGGTLREIAYEKACIAKPRCPMVIGPMDGEARDHVRAVAVARGASPVEWAGRTPWGEAPMRTALAGQHQQDNASVAAALCFHAARKLDRLTLGHVQEAVGRVSWPGRMESIHRNGVEILLDGAHNPDGVDALASHLETRGMDPSRVAIVFGAMRDKPWAVMVERLRSLAVRRFYVEPRGRAPASLEELSAVADGRGCRSAEEAIERASLAVGAGGLVVVCGSLFLVAEARAMLLGLESDPLVAL